MADGWAKGEAEAAALREQLRAAQAGAAAPYRLALASVAQRAEAHARACGLPTQPAIEATLLLVHALRHTYDPARDPMAWVDAIIARAAPPGRATRPAATAGRAMARQP